MTVDTVHPLDLTADERARRIETIHSQLAELAGLRAVPLLAELRELADAEENWVCSDSEDVVLMFVGQVCLENDQSELWARIVDRVSDGSLLQPEEAAFMSANLQMLREQHEARVRLDYQYALRERDQWCSAKARRDRTDKHARSDG